MPSSCSPADRFHAARSGWAVLLFALLLATQAFCGDDEEEESYGPVATVARPVKKKKKPARPAVKRRAEPEIAEPPSDLPPRPSKLGRVPRDALLLGMETVHTSGRKELNDHGNLVGFQYHGWTLQTYNNSYRDQTYFGGIARRVWSNNNAKGFGIDLQYKAGLIHGYGDRYPNAWGFTPLIVPIIGINLGAVGCDLIIVPDPQPVFSFCFRINLR